jgi:iron complex outermembrane receptor protein
MKIKQVRVAVSAALGGCAALSMQPALPQVAGLEEIVVTATRRVTDLQDTPMAITAISAEALTVQNIENPQDLTAVVPNVLFYGSGRGITNGSFNMRGIPNVGTYVDGVWQVSNAGLLQRQFVELDRVEVLRGPQGTLVGRDSAGGSVMVYTRPPQEEFGASIKLGTGSFDRRDVSAAIDIPLTEKLLTRWTLASYEKDGYVESVTTGINHGLLENQVLRGDLLWTPTDKLSLRLIRQEDEQVNTTAGLQTFINYDVAYRFGWQVGIAEAHHIASIAAGGRGFDNASQVAGFPGGQLDEYQSTKALTSPDSIDIDSTTLILEYDVNDLMSIKYTYGDTELLDTQWTDFAGAQFNFFTNYDVGFREFDSHEFQVNFNFDRVHFVVGAFAWNQDERTRGTEWSHSDWSFPGGWGGGAGGSVGGPPVGVGEGTIPFPGFFQTIDAGVPQTLSYDDVLAHPTCTTQTPADLGYDFSSSDPNLNPSILSGNGQFPVIDPALDPNTVAGWPRPCNAFNSWVPLFATVVGFNGTAPAHDRGSSEHIEGWALFGDVTFDITDRWDVTFGFRHHNEDNEFYDNDVAGGVAAGTVEGRPSQWDIGFVNPKRAVLSPQIVAASLVPASFDQTTYRFGTSYNIRDDLMLYASYSEGFTAGGADQSADSLGTFISPFDPEVIENIEVGLRGDFVDGRLRFNATYFTMDWVGVQAAQSVIDRATGDPITEVFLSNASDAEANGVELELSFAATDNLLLGIELGWLDTAYVNVKPTAQYNENTEFGGAPEETYNLWGQYDWGLSGGGNLTARLSGNYHGNFWRSSIVNFRPDVYGGPGNAPSGDIWRFNARVVYTPAEGDWELAGFVNNITDEFYLNSGFMDSIWQFDFSGVDAPREYGLNLSMRF